MFRSLIKEHGNTAMSFCKMPFYKKPLFTIPLFLDVRGQ